MPLGGSGYLLYLHTLPTAASAKLCNALFLERAEERDGAPTHLGSLNPDRRGSPLTPHPGLYTGQGKKTYLNEAP